MNQWQKVYCDTYYSGKMPRSQKAKKEFRMLGLIGDTVTVEFPERTETYTVIAAIMAAIFLHLP